MYKKPIINYVFALIFGALAIVCLVAVFMGAYHQIVMCIISALLSIASYTAEY